MLRQRVRTIYKKSGWIRTLRLHIWHSQEHHDTQHKDTQQNNIKHDTQYDSAQQTNSKIMVSVVYEDFCV